MASEDEGWAGGPMDGSRKSMARRATHRLDFGECISQLKLTGIRDVGIAIRHLQGYTSILQGLEELEGVDASVHPYER